MRLRLRLDRSRPLIQSEADLKEIYEERANLYQKYADIIINDDEEIAEITVKINEYFSNKWTKS